MWDMAMASDPIRDLRRITSAFTAMQRKAFTAKGPSADTRALILTELLPAAGLSISEIASRIGSDRPWVSQVVEQLRKDGLLERTQNEEDRRRVRVRLTPQGRRLAADLRTALTEEIEQLFAGIPVAQRPAAHAFLRLLAEAFERQRAQQR
jgi:DNA-binding MarR family transcriptional regulator